MKSVNARFETKGAATIKVAKGLCVESWTVAGFRIGVIFKTERRLAAFKDGVKEVTNLPNNKVDRR